MPDRRNAVREAHLIYKTKDSLDAKKRDEKIALLVSHDLWSNRNIIAITGATPWFVTKVNRKTNKKGGNLNPESLETIERIIRLKDKGEVDRSLYEKVVADGTSVYVLAALLGEPVTTVKRRAGLIERDAA